jgi:DNA adenine methylase
MLKPLFKYAGGKFEEYDKFSRYIPDEIVNYFEPFAGSCGVYLQLKNEDRISNKSYINDISNDLISFFKEISKGTVADEVQKINSSWKSLKDISSVICDEFGENFRQSVLCHNGEFDIDAVSKRLNELLNDCSSISQMNFGKHNICEYIINSLHDKVKRFSKKEIVDNIENIVYMCISTAIYQGFYFTIRAMYNEWLNNETATYTSSEKAAHWFFIREMCYGSMFRFNANGEFNIPYGGFSYNKKTFDKKIENISSQETINAFKDNICLSSLDFEDIITLAESENDFMFLDPPYDSTFSDYDNNTFGRKEHERLSNALKVTKCKWMMVIKNTEFIYNLYKDWCNIMSFDKKYMYQARGREYDNNVEHLVITNYEIVNPFGF